MKCEHVGAWTRWVSLVVYDDVVWEYHGEVFGGSIMNAADKTHYYCFSIYLYIQFDELENGKSLLAVSRITAA